MLGNKAHYQSSKYLIAQGMEVGYSESIESDSEDEEHPDNEELAKKSSGGDEEEEEVSSTLAEQQENTDEEDDWHTCSEDEGEEEEWASCSSSESAFHNSSRLLHKDELLDVFKAAHNGPRCKDGQLTVGLVGRKLLKINL